MVWGLTEFIGCSLEKHAKSVGLRHKHPHFCDTVELPTTGLTFPLKAEYDRVNHTLEGMREMADRGLLPGQDLVHMPNIPHDGHDPRFGYQLEKLTQPIGNGSGRTSALDADGGRAGSGGSGDASGRTSAGGPKPPGWAS